MRGWRWPAAGGTPRALKLYDLNDLVLHDPLESLKKHFGSDIWKILEERERGVFCVTHEVIISAVSSTSCFPI